jgi:hypothetical protein
MRSKSRAKRSNTELNPLIGDFINTIGQSEKSRRRDGTANSFRRVADCFYVVAVWIAP